MKQASYPSPDTYTRTHARTHARTRTRRMETWLFEQGTWPWVTVISRIDCCQISINCYWWMRVKLSRKYTFPIEVHKVINIVNLSVSLGYFTKKEISLGLDHFAAFCQIHYVSWAFWVYFSSRRATQLFCMVSLFCFLIIVMIFIFQQMIIFAVTHREREREIFSGLVTKFQCSRR